MAQPQREEVPITRMLNVRLVDEKLVVQGADNEKGDVSVPGGKTHQISWSRDQGERWTFLEMKVGQQVRVGESLDSTSSWKIQVQPETITVTDENNNGTKCDISYFYTLKAELDGVTYRMDPHIINRPQIPNA